MSGYSEGKHEEPTGTVDRLVRVGSKYQAVAPVVADGDSIYFLVDQAGRLLISGAVATNAEAEGNPVYVGGGVDDRFPSSAGEGDVGSFRATPKGNQIVEVYKGNDSLVPLSAMPGASEVKSATASIGSISVNQATIVTPTRSKKVRIISLGVLSYGLNTDPQGVYFWFGTGASHTSVAGKAIAVPSPGQGNRSSLCGPMAPALLAGLVRWCLGTPSKKPKTTCEQFFTIERSRFRWLKS